MKRTTISLFFLLCLTMGWAQNYSVNPQEASMEDYIKLLEFAKYEAFSFDVSSLIDSTRVFEFYYREYERENMVAEKRFCMYENRKMISDFREEEQKEIHEEGSAFNEANGVYQVAQKIVIGFTPLKNDSTERAYVDIENMAAGGVNMPVRPAVNTKTGETHLEYIPRPYKVSKFEFNKFIPLVLYGSFWYDEKYDFFRMCGENEIDPDKGSWTQKYMPHYYIIGMVVRH